MAVKSSELLKGAALLDDVADTGLEYVEELLKEGVNTIEHPLDQYLVILETVAMLAELLRQIVRDGVE